MNARTVPIAWTIAGSDSGGGAGIQADIKTFHGFGVHGCSVLTAVTAQSTLGIRDLEPISPRLVQAQCDALAKDLPPAAVKIGMLATAETVGIVARQVRELAVPVICDPILASTSRTPLIDDPGLDVLRKVLLPEVDLLIPNLPETAVLLRHTVETPEETEAAGAELLALGPKAVLITGGHRDGPFCQDYYTDGRLSFWITSPRQQAAGSHGTGCVLSSAIAAGRALGWDGPDSVTIGKAYLNQSLRESLGLGAGDGPVHCGAMPANPDDMPWVTSTACAGRRRLHFPPPDNSPLGLYPVVDSLEWVRRLLPYKPRTLQLRIKDPAAPRLADVIAEAVRLARDTPTRLYINDHWRIAIQCGAHGVHLGQDDLDPAALSALADAGLRLGISTHSAFEIARALACQPTYLALGTLFHTDSKVMDYPPLGLDAFARLRKLIPCPTVAIGGIHLHLAESVRNAGADGQAVISEITHSPNLDATLHAWRRVYPSRRKSEQ